MSPEISRNAVNEVMTERSNIDRALDELENALMAMHEDFCMLDRMLENVMKQPEPAEAVAAKNPDRVLSPMESRIRQMLGMAQDHVNHINSIKRRIEV